MRKIKPLDASSPIPLKVQAEMFLRKFIQQEEFQNGKLLPDENSLARQLGVSRGTIRDSIGRLVYEELLERRAGVGTRVVNKMSESGIGAWRSLTLEMKKKGVEIKNFKCEFATVPASLEAARALDIKEKTPVFRLDRLRGWNDQRILHSRSWFHPKLKLKDNVVFDRPLYDVLEQECGWVAGRAKEVLLAVAADEHLAAILEVALGDPLLLRKHTVFDRTGHAMEFAEVHYVSDRFSLTLDLHRGD